MMEKVKSSTTRRFQHSSTCCYVTIVQSFVHHYCRGLPFYDRARGYLRARAFKSLLALGEEVEQDLIRSATRESLPDTVYPDANSFRLATQFAALITKYQFSPAEIRGLDPAAAAIQGYLDDERRNRRLNAIFAAHLRRGTERHWCIPLIRDVFCHVLARTPHYEDVLSKSDFSGGSAVKVSGNRTHLAAKLGADMLSGNPRALPYFVNAVFRNKHYLAIFREDVPVPATANVPPFGSEACFSALSRHLSEKFNGVMHDELCVVPKKAKSGRTIAKNPPVNNFVQKGLDLVMRHLLKTLLGIDLSDQGPNQQLSFLGSLEEEHDPYVTIDVRGASNSVITELVRAVTPPRWFKLMDCLRSTHTLLPSGVMHENQMFVSMGNGFCFPLESLLFAAICKVAHKVTGTQSDFRVYGDDIVVRQSHALVVLECLRACGFRPNVQKTYVFGPFRESCGANWYNGEGVTPGYLKEPIVDVRGLHVIHNALYRYPDVQRDIRALIPVREQYVIPDTGHWSWVTDHAFRVSYDEAINSRYARYDRNVMSFDFKILRTYPVPDEEWEGLGALCSASSDRFRVAAALRGSTYEEPFHLRRSELVRATYTNHYDERNLQVA